MGSPRFLAKIFAVFFLVYLYLGVSLIFHLQLPWIEHVFFALLLFLPFAFTFWLPAFYWRDEGPETVWKKRLQVMAFASMGILSVLLTTTLARDILGIFSTFFFLKEKLYSTDATLLILAISALLFFIGNLSVRTDPKTVHIDILIPSLAASFENFTIAQISDLHIGSATSADFVVRVVNQINSLSPDLIALTGDIGDGDAAALTSAIAPLKNLRSKEGNFYVTGNHEYYWSASQWIQSLQNQGLKPLINSHHTIQRGSDSLVVAGIEDLWSSTKQNTAAEALKGSTGRACARVLLSHQPQIARTAAKLGYDLQISGHTHGGQIFPWTLVARWVHPFLNGLYRIEGLRNKTLWVYVNPGTGFWGPPLRLGTRSQIAVLHLRSH